MILNYTGFHHLHRLKRSVHAFTPNCKDTATLWNPGKIVAASFFTPGVAAAQALTTLTRLGCWLAKQTNATSIALSGLLLHVDSIKHATLQNRVAIDFLLLAHGHGCQDLEGVCCMNLLDHSQSIHASIRTLMEQTKKLQQDDGFFGLDNLLKGWGITGLLLSLVKGGLLFFVIIICIVLIVPCLLTCLQNVMQKMLHQVLMVVTCGERTLQPLSQ